jgi:PKHD-type hydroxylase
VAELIHAIRALVLLESPVMIAVHSVRETFSGADCARLLDLIADAPARDAGLVRQTRDHNLRRADLVWLDEVEGTGWVMDRMIDLVRSANRDVFDFDITDFAESPQIARYGAEREGHFGWHSDVGEGRLAVAERRKLTIVVQLSDPDSYEGGDLEVMPGSNSIAADRNRGTATLFPSFVLHRFTPVTSGERHSLTVWCHGAPLR